VVRQKTGNGWGAKLIAMPGRPSATTSSTSTQFEFGLGSSKLNLTRVIEYLSTLSDWADCEWKYGASTSG
jgi:hypothetical protein